MEDRDRFLYCLVCMKEYKNKRSYNDHLTKKLHKRKFAKLELLNYRELIRDKNKWNGWKESNDPK